MRPQQLGMAGPADNSSMKEMKGKLRLLGVAIIAARVANAAARVLGQWD
eukprot:CAMPEP_0204277846 /NCGR_PEP_ID=MMETSP0468-20130131/29536_1 /ASSEMBLY_ACC=CAM_ASM_000383 /TAXON_ID=2969 /ORGANISM="Oxyrrhis marina" /LENGTH=48 /DNA_ID= /DNA_START= /DNA_END= /DNA_ORIENTATION=